MASERDDIRTPELSGQTIVIGLGAPLSGLAAVLRRGMTQAVQIAVDELNQKGGIFGAEVRLAIFDDAGDIRKGDAVARRMCEDAHILAVVGHYNSNVTLAASIIYDNDRVTMLTPIWSRAEVFRTGGNSNRPRPAASLVASKYFGEADARRRQLCHLCSRVIPDITAA